MKTLPAQRSLIEKAQMLKKQAGKHIHIIYKLNKIQHTQYTIYNLICNIGTSDVYRQIDIQIDGWMDGWIDR